MFEVLAETAGEQLVGGSNWPAFLAASFLSRASLTFLERTSAVFFLFGMAKVE